MEGNISNWGNGFKNPPHPYWIASVPETEYPALEYDVNVDVAIVGGGMSGITTAFLLKQEGLRVAVMEADRLFHGTSGHTTAKVTSQHNLIYDKIKNKHGEEKARQYADANETAIDTIATLIKQKNIDCDFHRCSSYVYTHDDGYIKKIQDEAKTASDLGIKAAYVEETPLPFRVKAAVRFDNQARFHPLKYLSALAREIPGDGSHIFEHTKALDIEQDRLCKVVTGSGKKVSAEKVIIVSHYPFYDGYGMYFARIYPERSYALGVRIRGQFPGGMYITAEEPGRSLRSQEFDGGELVIVSGEHHKTGQGEDTRVHYENLKDFVEQNFDVLDIPYRWSTQDYKTADDVPYAGHLTSKTPNLFVATGFAKWGMTNSTASAMIIKDLIIKGESPWEPVYNPSRFTPGASAKNFIVENIDVAKHLISSKLSAVPDNVDIEIGEGKVVEINGEKVGVYRDEKGKFHRVDTTCTHMRCELQWNAAEKSWDCPCHGSRFTYEGEIIEGPALIQLGRKIEVEV